jgi:hypothetical protein
MAFEVGILPPTEWHHVAPIVRAVFHNAMPQTEKQAIFLTAFNDEGKMRGFVHLEVLLHVNSLYVAPEERNTRMVWQLMAATDELLRGMPGYSAIAFPASDSHRKLYQRLGARELGMREVWRKDY